MGVEGPKGARSSHLLVGSVVGVLPGCILKPRAEYISLSLLCIGCGCLRGTLISFTMASPRAAPFCPMIGLLWPFGLISLGKKEYFAESSAGETGVIKAIVLPAGSTLGTNNGRVAPSVWVSMNVNISDPSEVALTARVKLALMGH